MGLHGVGSVLEVSWFGAHLGRLSTWIAEWVYTGDAECDIAERAIGWILPNGGCHALPNEALICECRVDCGFLRNEMQDVNMSDTDASWS